MLQSSLVKQNKLYICISGVTVHDTELTWNCKYDIEEFVDYGLSHSAILSMLLISLLDHAEKVEIRQTESEGVVKCSYFSLPVLEQ